MMRSNAKSYDELRQYLETVPLVDTHDHSPACGPVYTDPIRHIAGGLYFDSDLLSVLSLDEYRTLCNRELSPEQRWPVLERGWQQIKHTGYAQVVRRVLKKFYNEDSLTLEALKRMQDKLIDLEDRRLFDDILDQANIAVRLEDVLINSLFDGIEITKQVLDGTYTPSPRGKVVISLPAYHDIRSYEAVQSLAGIVGRTVTSLPEYLDVCREIFEGCKAFGAVAFKDQSAYTRSIQFGNPTYAEAEEVFNWIMSDHRRCASYPNGTRPLDDFLFHSFLRMARDMDLPVQIHTGHMAGQRNDIVKANAVHLTSILELHRDVRFDLFHANWPYAGELLFLAKNYPNVHIDFCWANIIDPVYCQNLFKQALSCVPHGKIHGYGSDFDGRADRAWAHASIARDNIAIALADMVEIEYLDLDDAKQVGYDWLFGNANRFFRLGL